MDTLPIKDRLFSHAFSSSNWFKPTSFAWDFNNTHKDFVFLTDWEVTRTAEFPNLKKYAWLVESPGIMASAYKFVRENPHLFDKIFTHNRTILEENPGKAFLVPIGGCHLEEDQIHLNYTKTKLISMMYSGQTWLPGHALRHFIAAHFPQIDCMGSGRTGAKVHKIHACADYKFQVVIENVKEDYYFTEKIIDCFLSGVIPIYWGCPSIGNFFNTKGFLTFDSLDDFQNILDSDLETFWNDHQEEIKQNFNTALVHKVGDDYIWENYREIL